MAIGAEGHGTPDVDTIGRVDGEAALIAIVDGVIVDKGATSHVA